MAELVYSAITSLDGYVADETGNFDWAAPDEEVHAFVNELVRPIGTFLYGRRMYEVMQVWETMPTDDEPPAMQDFAHIWRSADKVVYSTTLERPSTPRTLVHSRFDPEAVRRMKAEAERDIGIGGPGLAAHAIAAGLVDEYQLLLTPVVVGGGTRALPDGVHGGLELRDVHRFAGGVVYLRYGTSARS